MSYTTPVAKSIETYKVHMLAFNENDIIREVDVPFKATIMKTTDEILEVIFTLGQNHNQPKPIESVSVGDVIEMTTDDNAPPQFWLVASCGFERITVGEFTDYRTTEQYHRRGHEVRNR